MDWTGCDSGRILADVHSLQAALNSAEAVNLPAHLVADVKNSLQNFIQDNPVLQGTSLFLDAAKQTQADEILSGANSILEKIDYDVEMTSLPFEVHRKIVGPIAEVQRVAKDLSGASHACAVFRVPVEFSFI